MRKIISYFLLFGLIGIANASNEDRSYVQVGIAMISVDYGLSTTDGVTLDDEDTAPIVIIGYKLNDNLALEGGIIGSAETSASVSGSGTSTYRGETLTWSASATATAESDTSWMFGAAYHNQVNNDLNITARAGLLFWDVDYKVNVSATYNGASVSAGGLLASADGNDPYFGVGADYKLTDNIVLDLSYLTTEIDNEDTSALTLGIKHKF